MDTELEGYMYRQHLVLESDNPATSQRIEIRPGQCTSHSDY